MQKLLHLRTPLPSDQRQGFKRRGREDRVPETTVEGKRNMYSKVANITIHEVPTAVQSNVVIEQKYFKSTITSQVCTLRLGEE